MKLQASHHGRDERHQAPPAVQTWFYRLDKAASDSNLGNAELGLRQSASDLTLGAPVPEGKYDGAEPTDDGAESELSAEAPHIPLRTADPRGLVADLNLVDVDPSPRRRWRPGRAS